VSKLENLNMDLNEEITELQSKLTIENYNKIKL